MASIGVVLERNKGIGPGFDFLRVALATSIVLAHSFQLIYGLADMDSGHAAWFLVLEQVPMFFALSGFLVTGSAMRLRLRDFVLNRSLRIVPALAVDIVVAALLIGPLMSVVPFSEYVTSSEFYLYFFNIIGFPHYRLPGVFGDNPLRNIVNGSLWTVSFEIGCYIIISILIYTQVLRSSSKFLVTFFIVILLSVYMNEYVAGYISSFSSIPGMIIAAIIRNYTNFTGSHLYIYFVGGIFFYIFRFKIPHTGYLAVASICFIIIISVIGSAYFKSRLYHLLFMPVIVYLTAYIGLMEIPDIPLYKRGDYSYGMYLYGFPLQQTLILMLGPQLGVWPHFAMSMLVTTAMAMFSWHFIEKPILRLRKKFSYTARKGSGDSLSHNLPTATADAPQSGST